MVDGDWKIAIRGGSAARWAMLLVRAEPARFSIDLGDLDPSTKTSRSDVLQRSAEMAGGRAGAKMPDVDCEVAIRHFADVQQKLNCAHYQLIFPRERGQPETLFSPLPHQ